MMKTAVVDIGSNSVRCAIFDSRGCVWRDLVTSRLGEGIADGLLKSQAVCRTLDAISKLKREVIERGAEIIYAFATEAVRRAANGDYFISRALSETGLKVFLADKETEAEMALFGALKGGDGCVIDLGGASTELAVRSGGEVIYSRSIPVGAVVLKDACGRDENKLAPYIAQKTAEYGEVPLQREVYAVGGTATSLAAIKLGLKEYDSEKVNGTVLSSDELDKLKEKLKNASPEEISDEYCTDKKRAEIIFGGALLLAAVAKKTGAEKIIVSESDNLEGFFSMLSDGKIAAEGLVIEK
ncbi:MAG: hypothetical protein J6126_00715 [Clostridia bacterium]|nr:hypothetical protein [Clostridia bacterium]